LGVPIARRGLQTLASFGKYAKMNPFPGGSAVSNPFSVQVSCDEGLSLIRLEGFVDAHTAPEFEAAVQNEVVSGRHRLIVDCEKLSYISSAGLGVFMSFIEEVRGSGGDIKICGLLPKVRHTFEILGFHEIFDILDNETIARQRFGTA
jgi:anti-sigma B factor antagonist